MKLITEEVFFTKITEIGFTKVSMGEFFKVKMPLLEHYKSKFLESVTAQFTVNLVNIEGFTAEMQQEAINVMQKQLG
jgi:hypothetical protein